MINVTGEIIDNCQSYKYWIAVPALSSKTQRSTGTWFYNLKKKTK